MAIRDHINRTPKLRAKVTTVDMKQGIVEVVTADGSARRLAGFDVSPFYRAPMENEEWSIYEENGNWILGGRFPLSTDRLKTSVLAPGEALALGTKIFDANGARLAPADLDEITDGQILVWNGAQQRFVPANESGGGGIDVLDEYSTVTNTTKLNFVGPMVTAIQDLTYPDEATVAVSLNVGQPHICTGGSSDIEFAITTHTNVLETDPADSAGRAVTVYPDGPAEIGTVFTLSRLGSGVFYVQLYAFGPPNVTVRGKGGVAITGDGHYFALDLRGTATLRLRAANDWVISGDVTYV